VLERNESGHLIGDSARTLLDDAGGIGRARRRRAESVLDRAVWDQMAAHGWFGMLVPEAAGGSGFAMIDTIELLEAIGAVLAPEPVAPVLAAASALAALNSDEARALRDGIVAGQVLAFVVSPAELRINAKRLSGRTDTHANLHFADTFLVGGWLHNEMMLFSATPGLAGLSVATARTVDGGTAGHLLFDGADVSSLSVLARGSTAEKIMRDATDVTRLWPSPSTT
jgi:alkylation response protein AidB-like acyl-CoA dehydrogenase